MRKLRTIAAATAVMAGLGVATAPAAGAATIQDKMVCHVFVYHPVFAGPNRVVGSAQIACDGGHIGPIPVLAERVKWVAIEVEMQQKVNAGSWFTVSSSGDFEDGAGAHNEAGANVVYQGKSAHPRVQYRTVVTAAEARTTGGRRVVYDQIPSGPAQLNVF